MNSPNARLPINENTIRSLQAQLSLLERSLGRDPQTSAPDLSQTLPAPIARYSDTASSGKLSRLDELTNKLKEKLDQIEQPINRSPNAYMESNARFNYTFPSQGRLDFDAYEMKEEESSEMKDKIAAIEGMKALERLEARKKRSDIQRKMDETRKELEFLKKEEERLEIEQIKALSMKRMPYREMNSVNVEVGSPDNDGEIDNSDSEHHTYTVCRDDENQLAERISSLERVIVKVLAENEDNKNQIAELKSIVAKKSAVQNAPPASSGKIFSSTPHKNQKQAKGGNLSRTARETLHRVENLFKTQPESTAFFATTMALLSVAKTPNIQKKIKEVIQSEIDGTGSEIEISDGEVSEIDREQRLADLYEKQLPDYVESLLEPLITSLVQKDEALTHADVKDFVDKFSLNAGVLSLPARQRDSFKGQLLLHLSSFIGNTKIQRATLENDLVKFLATLVDKIRSEKKIDADGDNAPVTQNIKTGAKIQFTDAELQALTSYGSGEDDSAEDFDEVDIIEETEASFVAGLGEEN
ncbi:Oidioi.mRNA.OKI2018_I69.chr2.g5852.t1.cds [Oikopleura dioica]|uniref:Oidioi.mRNA.OKI2018_I69.chr2.g5852.t1.cds n=1 Tax=Oikopleura dioica TaxID=34765 RepID=A0ABN7T4T2_OIKDI|nr:Oidioi.mRNA.OKI2018_I69.chr2.g5852.t1.cds [Oikopleura dioica]